MSILKYPSYSSSTTYLPDHTVGVDEEQSTKCNALLFNQDAVVFTDAVVLVAQQGDVDLAESTIPLAGICPGQQAVFAICAGEDDAGAAGSKVGSAVAEGNDLGRADEGPGHGNESKDDPLLVGGVGG